MKSIDVTCAIIIRSGKILVTQRGQQMARPGKWEFPGGKIENGETTEECIKREIKEELNLDINVIQWINPVSHCYPDIGINLIPCIAEIESGEIKLNEHSKFDWITKDDFAGLDWSTADISVAEQLLEADF